MTRQEVYQIAYQLDNTIAYLSKKKLGSKFYGYFCEPKILKDLEELHIYRSVLIDKLLHFNETRQCLNDQEFQQVVSAVNTVTETVYCEDICVDLNIDESQLQDYLRENPYCTTFEDWNRLSKYVCRGLSVELKIDKEQCNIAFDLFTNKLHCDILYALSVAKNACDLNYDLKIKKEDCKVEYKLLKSELDCNLNFEMYYKLVREYKLTPPMIKDIYKHGNKVIDNGTTYCIQTPTSEYPINLIEYGKLLTNEDFKKVGLKYELTDEKIKIYNNNYYN